MRYTEPHECECSTEPVQVAVETVTILIDDWVPTGPARLGTICPRCGRPLTWSSIEREYLNCLLACGASVIRRGDGPLPFRHRVLYTVHDREAVPLRNTDEVTGAPIYGVVVPDEPAVDGPALFDQDAVTEVDEVLGAVAYPVTEEGEAAIQAFREQLETPGLLESVVEAIADVEKGRTPWSRKRES